VVRRNPFGDSSLESKFNFPLLPGTLPQSLIKLRFSDEYNQPIAKDVLPSSLTELYIGYRTIDLETL
jgi:hypothetical protein